MNLQSGIIVLLLVWAGCSPAPRYHYRDSESPSKIDQKQLAPSSPEALLTKNLKHTAVFTASYYGPKFHGRLTSNGEVFDMYDYTAAHKSLPFGTVLKITYPSTGRSVLVRVNDRGPFIAGRDIDLSYGAARKIGLVKNGVGKVKVTVVSWGEDSDQ